MAKYDVLSDVTTSSVILIIAGIVGIFGGISIFYLVGRFKGLRTATNYYILNLLIWTMLYGFVRQVITYSIMASHSQRFIYHVCNIFRMGELCSLQMCIFCIILVYNSYLLACKPESAKQFHKQWKLTLACANAVGLVLFGLFFINKTPCVDMYYVPLAVYFLTVVVILGGFLFQNCGPPKYILGVCLICVSFYGPDIIVRLITLAPEHAKSQLRSITGYYFALALLVSVEALKGFVPLAIACVLLFCNQTFKLAVKKVKGGYLSTVQEQELDNYPNQDGQDVAFNETGNLNTPNGVY